MKRPVAGFWMLFCSIQTVAVLSVSAQSSSGLGAAWDQSSRDLSNQGIGGPQILMTPDSVNSDAGWALKRVGEKFSTGSNYSYPDTTTPVRLYLIDMGIRNRESFKAANPNLTFDFKEPIPIGGTSSVPRDHGTQMLSLIVGKDTGIAPGTPIHVVDYDIYTDPDNETTTATLVADALFQTIIDHQSLMASSPMRAVICVATSSIDPYEVSAINDLVDLALGHGITVVLSAGNVGQDAAGFTPPSNGTKNGVICVGASDTSDTILLMSNHGSAVDILAPGLDVPTHSVSATSTIVPMTGTSPAAALVTGAVLAKLSANPTLTPAEVESAVKAAAKVSTSGIPILRSVVEPEMLTSNSVFPLTWDTSGSGATAIPTGIPASGEGKALPTATDSDSDGVPDIVETFHGMTNEALPAPTITLSANKKDVLFQFPISSDLFDAFNPFKMSNGFTWRIRCSSTMSDWVVPYGSLSKSIDAQGRAWLTATIPTTEPSCFARIEIIDPGTPAP